MNEPAHSPPPSPPPRKLGWLRFIIWILPSAVVPMCVFGPTLLGVPYVINIGAVLALGLTIYLAHFDALLRCQQLGIPKDHPRAAIGSNVFLFVMLQILVVPAIWLMIAWGFCALHPSF